MASHGSAEQKHSYASKICLFSSKVPVAMVVGLAKQIMPSRAS